MSVIHVKNLNKTYQVPERGGRLDRFDEEFGETEIQRGESG